MHEEKHFQTLSKDKVPVRQKIAFGFGSMAQCLGSYSIGNLANFVFNIGLGVSPFLVGLAQSIPRLWDAVSDPLMGHFSDNARTRFGRRRPFMLIGAVLMGLLFSAIWCLPKGWSEYAYFSWFLGLSLLFYTALTVFMVPWGALGLEMTRDYHERTRIQAFSNLFANIGAILMPWLFALTQLDIFRDGLQGAQVVGAGVGVVLMLTGFIPALFCKEEHFEEVAGQEKISLWVGLKTTCTNRVFMQLMLAVFLAASGFFTISTLSPYITIYYVMGGDTKAASVYVGWGGTAWVLSSILFVAPVTWLATHIGKKKTFISFLGINLLGHVSKIWCYNPSHPWLVVIPPVLIAAGFVALWTLGASMIADICDLDELHTGARREGSYQAVFGWILKTGMSVALLVGGGLLVLTGFDQSLGGEQVASTVLLMRVLEAGLPALAVAAAIFVALRYPLSEQRVHEIREKLKQGR
ncbi:MFS transporter [Tichowtungia aerotolerans]|uniref:MFS transporter n=1 Tax=Tichowtungia aerotolerans TaxID=2697043 RepID=A0A6P1MAW5_9BACT|nr:MFS transporter [Tichowtungia aerotolerans]QHI68696.1 MFS transporter [Tichowtungia aerotolerans]